jgi:SH3-like domain-containing protein
MKITILFTILIFSVNIFAQRNPAQTDVDAMCNVSAVIVDEDPKGLNVRSKPNSKSKTLGKIPYHSEGTMVDIIGYKENWAKIETARTAFGNVFNKTGWIYSPLLNVSGKPPVAGGAFVKTFKNPKMDDFLINVRAYSTYQFAGCYQDWVKIKLPRPAGKVKKGWIHSDFLCGDVWMGCKDD